MGEEGGEKRCLVTGGRGFAARHLVEMLLRSQEWSVRIADLAPCIKLDTAEEGGVLGAALESGRAVYVSADLRNKAQVLKAFEGVDVLFHMAAPDSSINNYKLHYSVNVEGTKNVIDACIECNVKRLIYTSSPSVVLDPVHGVHDGEESLPYPEKFNDSYSETKAEGEKLVIKANGKNGLLTCCIRPSSIFGPGDRLLVPSLVSAARAGKSKFIIGDGNNLYDFTYVENVAYGHMCAEQALASRETAEKAAGQAYFITNMQSIKFWEFISRIVEGLGYERPRIKVPVYIMMPVAHLVEWIYKIFSRYGMPVPQLSPSRIRLLTCSRTFKCTKAKNQLGYEPIVSLEEGLKKTIEYYSYLRAEQQSRKISKASVYLGNGKVADVLLWKDKKQALTAMFFLAFIYYYLFVSGFTLITALAKLLMIVTMFLFIHGILPEKMFGYKIEKIPPSSFIVPKEVAHQVGYIIGSSWNAAIDVLTSISSGKDWLLFFKVVLALLTISILGTMSLRSIYAIGVPFVFVAFFVYEKWEEEIDGMFEKALTSSQRLKTDLTSKYLRR